MHSSIDGGCFLVSGIGTEIVVESVRTFHSSPTIDRARAWLAKNAHDSNKDEDRVDSKITPLPNEDEAADSGLQEKNAPTNAESRKKLRAKRKEEIEKHLTLKPVAEPFDPTTFECPNREETGPSLKSSAENLVALEDQLLGLQSNFNQRLLEAAGTKISISNNLELNNKRIKEIHQLLKRDGQASLVAVCVNFLPGEYTSSSSSQLHKVHKTEAARKILVKGSIHDSDFLLYGDVDLSDAAQVLKTEARATLELESKQLRESTHAMIAEFNESLVRLRERQLELSLKLKIKWLFMDLKARQVEVLLDHDKKVEQLLSKLNGDELDIALKSALEAKNNELRAICALIPINIADIDWSDNSNSSFRLASKAMMDRLNCETKELESSLMNTKSEHLDLRRQRRRMNTSINKLKQELSTHRRASEELQIQKFGKSVDSGVLDISPVATADEAKQVDHLQNELDSYHRKDLEHAKKEQSKLKARLLLSTKDNTKLLLEVASLREQQLKFDQDAKRSLNTSSTRVKSKNELVEYEKLRAQSSRQKAEIEMLQLEIASLKSKCGHVTMNRSFRPL